MMGNLRSGKIKNIHPSVGVENFKIFEQDDGVTSMP